MLKSMESGPYVVKPDYEYGESAFNIRSAQVFHQGLTAALNAAHYMYRYGRLCRVVLPGGLERIDSLIELVRAD